jgi:ABC-2 type transport system permease protein
MTLTATLDIPRPRAGLRQAVGSEWAKLVTLRSTKWALLVTLVGTVLVTFLSTRGSRHHPAVFYHGFDPTNSSLAGLALGSLVMGILGVLSMTGEYGTGTSGRRWRRRPVVGCSTAQR